MTRCSWKTGSPTARSPTRACSSATERLVRGHVVRRIQGGRAPHPPLQEDARPPRAAGRAQVRVGQSAEDEIVVDPRTGQLVLLKAAKKGKKVVGPLVALKASTALKGMYISPFTCIFNHIIHTTTWKLNLQSQLFLRQKGVYNALY